jgi:peptidoglycan/LPS O-acetylase OafA/YrhL
LPEATKLLVLAACTLLVGIYAFIHARFYREGLPPLLDASVSMGCFVILVAAYIFGGRIGEGYGYLTEGRILGLFLATIGLRWFRARLGVEQARSGREL